MGNENSMHDPGSHQDSVERVAEKLEQAAKTPKKSNLHIIARGEQWIIKREGALKAYKVCASKDEAINNPREMLAKGAAKHIIIHFPDGTVARRI